jgi:hypothetical protein
MKKTLVSALTTALVVGAASTTFAAANPFSDVPADHWAYDAVTELQAKGVVNGFPDGTYRGNQNMTRYEMAQIIAKAMAKVSAPASNASAADKAMVDKLAAEFKDELANLGVRIDELESRMDNVKWKGYVMYEFKSQAREGKAARHVNRIKLGLSPVMKINDQWTAHANMEYGLDANAAHAATASNHGGGYRNVQFRVNKAWVDGKIGVATVKLGAFGTDDMQHGIATSATLHGAEISVPVGEDWKFQVAAGRHNWYDRDCLLGNGKADNTDVLMADPSEGYADGVWTYIGADLGYAKDKWDFGIGYRTYRGESALAANFADSMKDKKDLNIFSAGIGYHFSPAVYATFDYNNCNAVISDQKNSYNVQLNWQITKKIGVYAAYKRMSNPGTMNSAYSLQSYDADGQKGWEFGTDISLQKNVSACAYYFFGHSLTNSNNKLRMFYGNLSFKF